MIAVRSKNFMLSALFFATVIPTLLPVILVPLTGIHIAYQQLVFVIGVIANAHVGMTAWFYMGDNRYKAIISEDRRHYVILPLFSIALAFVLFSFYPKGIWPYFVIHYAWLTWHFGRQNLGLYSFVASGNRSGPVTRLERQYFNLLPLSIIPKVMTLYPDVGLSGKAAHIAVGLSIVLSVACAALAIFIIATNKSVQRDRQRMVALLLGFLFFMPTMVSSNASIALSFFAHPVQFVVMMFYLAADRRQAFQMLRVTLLVLTGIALWAMLAYLQVTSMPMFLAVAYGATQAHFIVDMGIWKLKLPKQRAAIVESYDFLFGARKQA